MYIQRNEWMLVLKCLPLCTEVWTMTPSIRHFLLKSGILLFKHSMATVWIYLKGTHTKKTWLKSSIPRLYLVLSSICVCLVKKGLVGVVCPCKRSFRNSVSRWVSAGVGAKMQFCVLATHHYPPHVLAGSFLWPYHRQQCWVTALACSFSGVIWNQPSCR